jgi:hypothetical protein
MNLWSNPSTYDSLSFSGSRKLAPVVFRKVNHYHGGLFPHLNRQLLGATLPQTHAREERNQRKSSQTELTLRLKSAHSITFFQCSPMFVALCMVASGHENVHGVCSWRRSNEPPSLNVAILVVGGISFLQTPARTPFVVLRCHTSLCWCATAFWQWRVDGCSTFILRRWRRVFIEASRLSTGSVLCFVLGYRVCSSRKELKNAPVLERGRVYLQTLSVYYSFHVPGSNRFIFKDLRQV